MINELKVPDLVSAFAGDAAAMLFIVANEDDGAKVLIGGKPERIIECIAAAACTMAHKLDLPWDFVLEEVKDAMKRIDIGMSGARSDN